MIYCLKLSVGVYFLFRYLIPTLWTNIGRSLCFCVEMLSHHGLCVTRVMFCLPFDLLILCFRDVCTAVVVRCSNVRSSMHIDRCCMIMETVNNDCQLEFIISELKLALRI